MGCSWCGQQKQRIAGMQGCSPGCRQGKTAANKEWRGDFYECARSRKEKNESVGIMMKAWVLHGIGDFRLETVGVPAPAAGEVLVAVKAAGICGSDVPRIYRTGAHIHPLIPGHEFAGIVTGAGADVDQEWIGQRVGVFPLIPCGACEPCRKRQHELCRSYSYIGSRRDGAFAEYVTVPAKNLLALPGCVGFEMAAMLEPMAVAVHAMRRIDFSGSGTVAVCGLGTIGLALLMFLLDMGRGVAASSAPHPKWPSEKIFVIGNRDIQKQMALKMGLPPGQFCDSRATPAGKWLMEHTDGRGVDVFFECVGKNETFVQAVGCAAPSGRVVLVGNPYSDMMLEKNTYWKILRNQLTVTGTWNSSFDGTPGDDWHYVLDRLVQHRVDPARLVSHRLLLEGLADGLEIMRDKTEDYVKVMMLV